MEKKREKEIYLLARERGEQTIDLDPFGDCAVPPEMLSKMLDGKTLRPLKEAFFGQRADIAREQAICLVPSLPGVTAEEASAFIRSDSFDLLTLDLQERLTPERGAFLRTRVHARVMIHSNYDCWVPPHESGGLYAREDALEGMMEMLSLNPARVKQEAVGRGVKCIGTFHNKKSRDGREAVTYKDFLNVLTNTPCYGLWTFFGRFDMEALWDSRLETGTLVIPAGTKCGMFNDWNGAGSLAFAETIRPVTIKELNRNTRTVYDYAKVYVDEKFNSAKGYSSGEVYGRHLSEKKILTKTKHP